MGLWWCSQAAIIKFVSGPASSKKTHHYYWGGIWVFTAAAAEQHPATITVMCGPASNNQQPSPDRQPAEWSKVQIVSSWLYPRTVIKRPGWFELNKTDTTQPTEKIRISKEFFIWWYLISPTGICWLHWRWTLSLDKNCILKVDEGHVSLTTCHVTPPCSLLTSRRRYYQYLNFKPHELIAKINLSLQRIFI